MNEQQAYAFHFDYTKCMMMKMPMAHSNRGGRPLHSRWNGIGRLTEIGLDKQESLQIKSQAPNGT